MIFQRIYSWVRQKDKIIYFVYGALALVVLLPLLKSGYVFAMDMIFYPHLPWPEPFNFYGFVLYSLNLILPSEIIQKVILFLIIFLSGIGMHKLIPTQSELPKYFAGILYIFNPFVYSRFLFGHIGLLMAYALMPFAVKAIFVFFENINLKNAARLSFWLILIGYVSVHFIVFVFLFFGIAVLFYLWKNLREKEKIIKIAKYAALIIIIFFTASNWWIASYLNKDSAHGQYVQETIGKEDFNAFQTTADPRYGVLLNVAALYGFWGDAMGQYTVPKDVMPYWPVLFLIIISLVIFGAVKAFKRDKFIAGIFLTASAIAFILSVGVAYKLFVPLINFLNENVSIFKGFRDSQKFTALLVLAYAYFGALGVNSILKNPRMNPSPPQAAGYPVANGTSSFGGFHPRPKGRGIPAAEIKEFKTLVIALLLALPILYSPLMVWGFRGQLFSSQYPQSWFAANEILNQDNDNFKTLFLPWHQYMSFGFIKNMVIANPAPPFFEKEVIAGDNMEIGKIYTNSQRPISRLIENDILLRKDEINNMGELIMPFNIKYIMLAKDADWKEYDFLNRQQDLEIINELDGIIIYKNKFWR